MSKSLLKRIGVSGYNKPKKTPSHPTKSHVVVAKEGDKIKTIRFGQQGVSGSPAKEGESEAQRNRRESFKARHRRNIAKGRMSAAYWSDRVKWLIVLTGSIILSGGNNHAELQFESVNSMPSMQAGKIS